MGDGRKVNFPDASTVSIKVNKRRYENKGPENIHRVFKYHDATSSSQTSSSPGGNASTGLVSSINFLVVSSSLVNSSACGSSLAYLTRSQRSKYSFKRLTNRPSSVPFPATDSRNSS